MKRLSNQKPRTLREVASKSSQMSAWTPQLHRPLLFSLSLMAIISGCLVIGYLVHPLIQEKVMGEGEEGVVLVEVKAVQRAGAPFAGAKVFVKNQFVGLTDSYGEWRRYMKLEPGKQVTLSIQRNHLGEPLELSKHVVVPLLTPQKDSAQRRYLRAVFDLEVLQGAVTPKAHPVKRLSSLASSVPNKVEVARQRAMELKRAMELNDQQFARVRILVPKADKASSPRVVQMARLLGKQFKAAGIEVMPDQAVWWVKLQHIAPQRHLHPFEGLLQVSSGWGDEDQQLSYLLNYSRDTTGVVQKIAKTLAANTPKKYLVSWEKDARKWRIHPVRMPFWYLPQSAVLPTPQGGWLQVARDYQPGLPQYGQELSTQGAQLCGEGVKRCLIERDTMKRVAPQRGLSVLRLDLPVVRAFKGGRAYIGGYPVVHESGSTYRFWAKPGHRSFLSVLVGDEVVHRQAISAPVAKPLTHLSRR
ncbi:MAG: hypothetical protein OXT67_10820 [Zetaproteobacteria bacterium]|nr:hypothetical protein [Zetaproteobacteria bacterium]